MINEENLNKIYESIANGEELTTKLLNSLGFNSKDLNDLIQQDITVRVKRGLYSLKSADDLFYYGKKLIAQREYDKSTRCFLKCFEINPTHMSTCFQLFLRAVQSKDYESALKYYDIFYNNPNEIYKADNNFFLFMLNMITELPENYRTYVKYLKFEDIRVDYNDGRYTNVDLHNKVRSLAMNQRFALALKQLNEIINLTGSIRVQDILLRMLFSQAIEVNLKNRATVINLIKEKRYDEIIDFYKKIKSCHDLSYPEIYTYKLVEALINIINTKKIPRKKVYSTENMFEAIDCNNFELALALDKNRQNKYNNDDESTITLLLEEIINICKELNDTVANKQDITPVNTFKKTIEAEEKNNVNKKQSLSNSDASLFENIFNYLMQGDYDNCFKTLRTYLIKLNKRDYEFLIVDLIKISLLEKDMAFTKPMTILTLISRGNYSFNNSTYIQEFYISLSENKIEQAKIYLDIISKAKQLGQECVNIDNLYQILDDSDNKTASDITLNIIDESLEKNEDYYPSDIKEPVDDDVFEEESTELIEPFYQTIEDEYNQEEFQKTREIDQKLLDDKYSELLEKKGIILLKPMDDSRIYRILEMANNYTNMVAFVIGEDNKKQVVLKYKEIYEEKIDCSEIISIAKQTYKDKNYEKCLECNLILLHNFDNPKAIVYSQLGILYMKMKNLPLAIDYLTVANYLSKYEKIKIDYSDLIARLKGDIPRENRKPYFRMTQDDFDYDDVNDNYGIENFTEINSFIMESGLDVETACEQLGLSLETIDIIKLIYAREFYSQENYEKGDLFIKSYERSENKTPYTKKIFSKIRKNKRFYKNRRNNMDTELALTLSPHKK